MQVEESSKQNSLLEQLKDTYPIEHVEPYGQVMIIPNRVFKPEWKQQLEAEGAKVYCSNYGSQAAFFVKLKQKQESSISVQKPEIDSKPSPVKEKKPWTLTERTELKHLQAQGLSVTEMAEKLNRSVFSIGSELRHICDYKPKHKRKPKEKAEEIKPETKAKEAADPSSLNDDVVKEFLSACSLLYPSHKTACAFLLKAASERMENRSKL